MISLLYYTRFSILVLRRRWKIRFFADFHRGVVSCEALNHSFLVLIPLGLKESLLTPSTASIRAYDNSKRTARGKLTLELQASGST